MWAKSLERPSGGSLFATEVLYEAGQREPLPSLEGRAEAALAKAEKLVTEWKGGTFLSSLGGRLGVKVKVEKERRLKEYWGRDAWKNHGSARDMAYYICLTNAVRLLAECVRKGERMNEKLLEACEMRIRWEETTLQGIASSIKGSERLEKHLGRGWKKTYNKMIDAMTGSVSYRRMDAVLKLSDDTIKQAIDIVEASGETFAELLKPDKDARYYFAESIDAANPPSINAVHETARESHRVFSFAETASARARLPVVYLCNARGGTIFSYSSDTVETQVNRALKGDGEQKRFWGEVRAASDGAVPAEDRENVAILKVATTWMRAGKIPSLVITVTNAKIPSSSGYQGPVDQELLSPVARAAITLGTPIVYADSSGSQRPRSSQRLEHILKEFAPQYQFTHAHGVDEKTLGKVDTGKPFIISLNPVSWKANSSNWYDDHPHYLGERARKFTSAHEKLDILVLEPAGYPVFISEKIEYTAKLHDLDAKGRHWYDRNFLGSLGKRGRAVKAGTAEYTSLYREWVPFLTGADGKPTYDQKGFVIVKESATRAYTSAKYLRGRIALHAVLGTV